MSKAAVKKPSLNIAKNSQSKTGEKASAKNTSTSSDGSVFDLDLVDFESELTEEEINSVTNSKIMTPKSEVIPNEIDFQMQEAPQEFGKEFKFSKADSVESKEDTSSGGFEIDESFYNMQSETDGDRTMKTIVFKPEDLKKLKEELVPAAKKETPPAVLPVAKKEAAPEDLDNILSFNVDSNEDEEESDDLMSFDSPAGQNDSDLDSPFVLDESDAALEIGAEIVNESMNFSENDESEELEDLGPGLELGNFDSEEVIETSDFGALETEEESEDIPVVTKKKLTKEEEEREAQAFLNDATTEFKLDADALDDVKEFNLEEGLGGDTSGQFDLNKLVEDDLAGDVEFGALGTDTNNVKIKPAPVVVDVTDDFLAESLEAQEKSDEFNFQQMSRPEVKRMISASNEEDDNLGSEEQEFDFSASTEMPYNSPKTYGQPSGHAVASSQDTYQEQFDVQSALRAMREEREKIVEENKSLKASLKETEQHMLMMRANLEESRIEVAILRKRHLNEIEDHKYRLVVAEDKMHRAQEMAKIAQEKSLKLEQKIRIDYSQVKHREKELESKLELLTMDVDAQINTRDQKILELRRKIDSLEFNMENASIREQKSNEDKKKLEDRLGKMMKTLKHSIKHLEDEIEEVGEEHLSQQVHKDKN